MFASLSAVVAFCKSLSLCSGSSSACFMCSAAYPVLYASDSAGVSLREPVSWESVSRAAYSPTMMWRGRVSLSKCSLPSW